MNRERLQVSRCFPHPILPPLFCVVHVNITVIRHLTYIVNSVLFQYVSSVVALVTKIIQSIK